MSVIIFWSYMLYFYALKISYIKMHYTYIIIMFVAVMAH